MANSPAPALVLFEDDEPILREWVRASTIKAGLARRARIVLLAADGLPNTRIAELTGSSVVTVLKWRSRYVEAGIAGLGDDPRSGRPKQLDPFDIVTTTLVPPPKKYGVTHWSSRLLGKHLKVGNATVARAWREYGIQPWKAETFNDSSRE